MNIISKFKKKIKITHSFHADIFIVFTLSKKQVLYDTDEFLLNYLGNVGIFTVNTEILLVIPHEMVLGIYFILYHNYTQNTFNNDMGRLVHLFDSESEYFTVNK